MIDLLQEASVAPDEEAGVARSKLKLYRWQHILAFIMAELDKMIIKMDMRPINGKVNIAMETNDDLHILNVRCSDDSGKLILTEVKDGPLLQVMIMIMISMMIMIM